MTKEERYQYIVKKYQEEHGYDGADLKLVAKWAEEHGLLRAPKIDPYDVLAKDLKNALRSERRMHNGKSYRSKVAGKFKDGNGKQRSLWYDLDESPAEHVERAFVQRREAIVGEVYQLHIDIDVFNEKRGRRYQLELNFEDDIDEREWKNKSKQAS
jgi:hypothetical protein